MDDDAKAHAEFRHYMQKCHPKVNLHLTDRALRMLAKKKAAKIEELRKELAIAEESAVFMGKLARLCALNSARLEDNFVLAALDAEEPTACDIRSRDQA